MEKMPKMLFFLSLILFDGCSQVNPTIPDQNVLPEDSLIMGAWYLGEIVIAAEDGGQPDTIHYNMTNFDYTIKVLSNICLVYAKTDQFSDRTFCDTLNYSLHNSKLVTEGYSDTLNVSIGSECMIIKTNDEEDVIDCKYYRYTGKLPPNGWPQINNSGLVRITAFYPDLLTATSASGGSD